MRVVGLLVGGEPRVLGEHRRDLFDAVEVVGERLDSRLAQALELCPPCGEQVGQAVVFPAHRGEAT